jgi:hypothetical protein
VILMLLQKANVFSIYLVYMYVLLSTHPVIELLTFIVDHCRSTKGAIV